MTSTYQVQSRQNRELGTKAWIPRYAILGLSLDLFFLRCHKKIRIPALLASGFGMRNKQM